MTTLCVVDCETGGLNPETDALLSVALVEWCDGEIRRQTEILIDTEGWHCSEQAMAVNKIDLDLHHAHSVPRAYAARLIQDFCRPMGRPVLTGHNVHFDIGFIRQLFAPDVLRKTVSHRTLDTLQVLLFLEHAGLIRPGIGNLDQAMAHFGLTMPEGKRHTALGDALVTAELYGRLLKVISGVTV